MSRIRISVSRAVVAFQALVFCLPLVASQCNRNPVIFNFGDSNSDTGGFAAATGFDFGYPHGRAFFHPPTGRICDGRLIIDFLCENLKTSYLTPYLDSLEPDFRNGANFAISGSTTLPRYVLFNLGVQVLQFRRFHNRSLYFQSSKGSRNVMGEEDFRNALYTIDIGQNDLSRAFNNLSYAQVTKKIPSFIAEIRDAMWAIYHVGGKNFWVHNTGPLGCLPEELVNKKPNASDFDEHGCSKSLNRGARAFNAMLKALCQDLRLQMKDSTIVYVNVYSVKYDLIANSASYGFKNPLMACCGHGGSPYNYDANIRCGIKGYSLCQLGSRHISWDGIHYTEAATAIIASKILSANYSTPPLHFDFFCS